MKKIDFEGLDISCYNDKLDNGLELFLIPYPSKKNYFMSYGVKFGSETTTFTPCGEKKEITVPKGIAHFLEHKMFEQEDGIDPFKYFAESGTGANAFTSFDQTQYICYGTKNFNENLKYLLKYVNSPYYTDENVEKEKGIIAEELNMYDDMPEWQVESKLREGLYQKHPRRVDIGGTVPEIMKITKEDLYTCYNNFYVPSNMFLLLVGNFDKDEALGIIKESLNEVTKKDMAKAKKLVEPKEVTVKENVVYGNVTVPKVAIGLKIPVDNLKGYDDLMLDLYLQMAATLIYGTSSLFREKARNKKLFSSFYGDSEQIEGFKVFYAVVSTNDPDEFIKDFKAELKNIKIDEEAFNRMKKVWIANEVKLFDFVDNIASNVADDIIRYGKVIPNKLEIFRKMNLKDLNDIISKIDFDNVTVLKYLCKK